MGKEFVPYDIALAIEELGGISGSFGSWYQGNREPYISVDEADYNDLDLKHLCPAPLYQQAFRWFREKYGLNPRKHIFIVNQMGFKTYKPHMDNKPLNEDDFWNGYDTYEEAQDACLRKLIEIVKEKQR